MRFITCICTAALSALFADSAQAQAPPTVTLSASPTSLWYPQSSTLAWTSANATACSGTGKGFSPSGPSGSLVVSPTATTTYSITCTGAGGSASQSVAVTLTPAPTLAVGDTVAATRKIYAYPTPSPSASAIGSEAPGNQGVVIGGPTSNSNTWWEVAFNDNLTGWTHTERSWRRSRCDDAQPNQRLGSRRDIRHDHRHGLYRSDGGQVRLDRRHIVHGQLRDDDHRESSGWDRRHGQGDCDDALWHVANLLRERK